jgi:hypothetical protein
LLLKAVGLGLAAPAESWCVTTDEVG